MKDLHNIQMLILRELLFKPQSRFTDLNIQGLTSDHFSYHTKTLIDDGYITKENSNYSLTPKGKEYANQMDTDVAMIEKQPKVAVMLIAQNDKGELLIQERTKEPYYGYKGFVTGKIRYGEKVLDTARRELMEETGLEFEKYIVKGILRDHVFLSDSGKLVEDKIFFVILATQPKGTIQDTECGKNYWIKKEDFKDLDPQYYNEVFNLEIGLGDGEIELNEKTFIVDQF